MYVSVGKRNESPASCSVDSKTFSHILQLQLSRWYLVMRACEQTATGTFGYLIHE